MNTLNKTFAKCCQDGDLRHAKIMYKNHKIDISFDNYLAYRNANENFYLNIMGKRRSSRELALKFLYQFELNKGDLDEQIILFLERNPSQKDVESFMKDLVVSLIDKMKEIDKTIQKYSDHWVLNRMAVIDRNILRIGTFELLFSFSIPPKVVINEAIDIAKKYGNEDSPQFINGILDRVYKEIGQKGPLLSTS